MVLVATARPVSTSYKHLGVQASLRQSSCFLNRRTGLLVVKDRLVFLHSAYIPVALISCQGENGNQEYSSNGHNKWLNIEELI